MHGQTQIKFRLIRTFWLVYDRPKAKLSVLMCLIATVSIAYMKSYKTTRQYSIKTDSGCLQ